MSYIMMKTFDCQDMPDDVREAFFNCWDNVGNDCYIKYMLEDSENIIEKWLLENGADLGEDVLINHWW